MPLDLAERVSQRASEGAGREDRQSERESRIEQSRVAPNSGSISQLAVTFQRMAAFCFTRVTLTTL